MSNLTRQHHRNSIEGIKIKMGKYSMYEGLSSAVVPSKGLNGTPILQIEDMPVGTVRLIGERRTRLLTVSVRVERIDRESQSIDHAPLTGHLAFAMSTTAWDHPKNNRDHYAGGAKTGGAKTGGAGRGLFSRLVRYEPGFSPETAGQLADLANRWHLNTLRAGCAHMPALSGYYDTYKGEICPETGYKFGSAWLTEPLPADFLATLGTLFAGGDQGRIWREGETPEEVDARRGHTFA